MVNPFTIASALKPRTVIYHEYILNFKFLIKCDRYKIILLNLRSNQKPMEAYEVFRVDFDIGTSSIYTYTCLTKVRRGKHSWSIVVLTDLIILEDNVKPRYNSRGFN